MFLKNIIIDVIKYWDDILSSYIKMLKTGSKILNKYK